MKADVLKGKIKSKEKAKKVMDKCSSKYATSANYAQKSSPVNATNLEDESDEEYDYLGEVGDLTKRKHTFQKPITTENPQGFAEPIAIDETDV